MHRQLQCPPTMILRRNHDACRRLGLDESEIRDRIRDIRMAESELLTQRTSNYQTPARSNPLDGDRTTIFASALVLGTYWLLRRLWKISDSSSFRRTSGTIARRDELARYNQRLLESTGEGIYGIDERRTLYFHQSSRRVAFGWKA